MKKYILVSLTFFLLSFQKVNAKEIPPSVPSIVLALLLDTISSMYGLIDQAKSQLWKMVNLLASAKKDGKSSNLKLALYEYGNDGLSSKNGYIRNVCPMTNDLDFVSDELFKLKTHGGSEFCGWAIEEALTLDWNKDAFKMIIIAGNEPFNQGQKDYKQICPKSKNKGIIVNTIFCGECNYGITIGWKDGADLGGGRYMCINTNDQVVHIETPYDDEIIRLNGLLNKTYVPYGEMGKQKAEMQTKQDDNAAKYGKANISTRAASKSSTVYQNDSWDLVDAYKKDPKSLDKVDLSKLSGDLKGKSKEEVKSYIESKTLERSKTNQEITDLIKKAEAFKADEMKKKSGENKTLDNLLLQAIKEQAIENGFVFE